MTQPETRDRARSQSQQPELQVTIVTPFGTDFGGSEQWLLSLVRHAPWLRFRAIVLQEGPLAGRLRAAGVAVVVLPTGASATAVGRASRGILTDLREHRPDVVMGNGVKAQLALTGPAALLHLPTVWIKHDHSFDGSLARPLGKLATGVVATASEVGTAAHRNDVVVIEPERPPGPLLPAQAREELSSFGYRRRDGRLTLAMLGRLVPYKGVDIGISALCYPQAADWDLVVIGGDDTSTPGEGARLARLATLLDLADRVTFTGPIPNAGRCLAAFDALAVLTRPGQARAPRREGYGITATEAMLAERPVIVAGEGPIGRRLRTPEGPAGIVVTPADPLSTARALGRLADPAVRTAMGTLGLRRAASLPTADAVAERTSEVLFAAAGATAHPRH